MAIAGTLEIQMLANMARLQADISQGKEIVTGGMAKIESAVASAKSALGALGMGIGIVEIVSYAKGLVDAAERMDKMSTRTGIAVEELSKLKFAASLGEVDMQQMGKAIGFFNLQTVQASNSTSKQSMMFRALGVDLTKGPNEALLQFAQRASSITDAAVKTAVFRAALGKTGDELIPVFQNLKETTDQAKRLGVVMSTDTAAAAAHLNDNLKALKAQTDSWTTKKMDGIVGAFSTITENIIKATEKGEKWLQIMKEMAKLNTAFGASVLSGVPVLGPAANALAESLFKNKPATLWDQMQANGGKPIGSGAPSDAPKVPPPNAQELANILSLNEARMDALRKRQIAAIQQMEEKKKSLYGMTEEEITLQRVQTGTYKDFDDATAVRLLNLAVEIDDRKNLLRVLELNGEYYDALYKSQDALNKLQTSGIEGDRAYLEDLQFQAKLLGKGALAQAQMTEARKIDLSLQQQLKTAAEDAGDNLAQYDKAAAALIQQAQDQKTAVLASVAARIQAEQSWSTGASSAMNDYLDNVASAANQSRNLFTDAFKGMEDALMNFVKTGKLDFKSLADSIITDLVRIQIQNSIMKPLAANLPGFASLIGNMIGPSTQAPAPVTEIAWGGKQANGGDYMVTRPTLFLAGEAGPERARFGGGSDAPNVTFQLINQTSQPVTATQSGPAQFDGEKWVVGVLLSALNSNQGVKSALSAAMR